jgi:predicted dinucleotide-binding enzyme
MKISVIGTGAVGQTIASKLAELDHDVMVGTRNAVAHFMLDCIEKELFIRQKPAISND